MSVEIIPLYLFYNVRVNTSIARDLREYLVQSYFKEYI